MAVPSQESERSMNVVRGIYFSRVPVKCETKSKRNETKRNEINRNEMHRNETKFTETKRNRNETK